MSFMLHAFCLSLVITVSEYNKLTENDEIFIHRWMQQRSGFWHSNKEPHNTLVDNCPVDDLRYSFIYAVKA